MKADPTRSPSPSSVPPVLDGHHPPTPEPLEWQKHLPDAADGAVPRSDRPPQRSGAATRRARDER